MEEKIRQHFNELFTEAPRTRKALDLKQEMMQSAIDKYDDMISDGYSKEDAYQNVIDSIGDVTELFPEVEEKNLLTLSEADRKKKAVLTSAAVGFYIFAGAVLLLCGVNDLEEFGVVLAILVCIPPTVMLVYAANMYPDYSKKENQDMVERYKEVKYSSNKEKAIIKSINSIIWMITLILYFLISFATYNWHVTWLLFLIAICVQKIVKLIFDLKTEEKHL